MGQLILQNPYLCRNYYEHAKFDSVVHLQERLNEVEPTSMLTPDGYFGEKTHETLKRYQQRMGIKADGVVGPETIQRLNSYSNNGLLQCNNNGLLNGKIHLDNNINLSKNNCYKNCDSTIALQKDAAALCQFVYACDPNRDGTDEIYSTATGIWKPFYIKTQKSPYSKKMLDVLEEFYKHNQQPLENKLDIDIGNEGLLNRFGYDGLMGIFNHEKVSLENRLANRITGFFSMIFYKKVTDTMYDIAYVTAGTTANVKNVYDIIVDNLLTNLPQGLLGISPQYTRSIQNAKILANICSKNSSTIRNLYYFGHSLGGGMAIANALATGHKAIVFNHAGLNLWRKAYGVLKDNYKNVTSYHTKQDFLTTESHQGMIVVNELLSIFCSSALDGKREELGDGGHGLVEIIKKHYKLANISKENINYKKGF